MEGKLKRKTKSYFLQKVFEEEDFVKKVHDLRGNICESNRINPLTHLCKTSDRELFTQKTVAETQVLAQIKKLNDTHSVGIDGIPTFVIKKVADILVTPITWIINSSIFLWNLPK